MSSRSPDWSLYRSFVAVLREGSLSGAARALGLSQPTLGRHIAELEDELGLALFTRSPDGLEPTIAAVALRPQAEALSSAADALFRAASGPLTENAGAVRVTASEIFAAEILPPILARLQEHHPGIVVELLVSNRLEDLLRRDADIAVRTVRPTQSALVASKVGAFELGLYAHSSYLDRRSAPRTPRELDGHAFVGFDVGAPYTRTLQLDGKALGRDSFTFRTDSDVGQFAAIRAGCGIGACHVPLATRAGLVRVLPKSFAPTVELWLAMHEDLRTTARCRTVFDALGVGLATYVAAAVPSGRRRR
ncbi:MAG: LysR family transcriptional regulator [Polyangiaceae bacterium]|nr:LysR family transcriptional regulator [Polyangiaceae bacterium]